MELQKTNNTQTLLMSLQDKSKLKYEILKTLESVGIVDIANELSGKTSLLYVKLQQNVTLERILQENPPTIKQTLQNIGLDNLQKVICTAVKFFCNTLQVQHKMGALDYLDFSFLFIEKYSNESIEDLILALKYAKTEGRKFYNAFGTQDLFEIFNEYQERKAQQREIQHYNLKNTSKISILDGIVDKANEDQEKYRNFVDLLKNKEFTKPEPVIKTKNLVDELNELKSYFSQDDISLEECLKFEKHCNVHDLKEHLEMIKQVMEGKSL